MKITIPKETMLEILDAYGKDKKVVEDAIYQTRRWSEDHEMVFLHSDGNHYSACYSRGLTEEQDEAPWEYEEEVECTLVHEVEKTVKSWEAVPDES